jgi:SsrA-binding protein
MCRRGEAAPSVPGGREGAVARKPASGDVATNRQARFKYNLLERWEAGLVLQGSEVKSLRAGKVNLKDSYAAVRDGELWLQACHIAPYAPAAGEGHDPERPRKLLLRRKEIERLIGKTQEKGLTLVPTRIYFSGPHAKVEIALARGKEVRDKREVIRERDQRREIERELKQRSR